MRGIGHYAGKLRRAASDFQRQFEEAMRESEVEEVRKAIESVKTETPSLDLGASVDKPVMLPKPSSAPATAAPKPATKPRKRVSKAKSPAKRGKTSAERAP
jgi:sec-independent protein translocase protein TatB